MVQLSATRRFMVVMLKLGWIYACTQSARKETQTESSQVVLESDKIMLICYSGDEMETLSPLNRTATVAVAYIENCQPPRHSYAATFRALEVNVTSLKKLSIVFHKPFNLTATYFEELSIKKLELRNDYSNLLWLDINILETLVSLTALELKNFRLLPLPSSIRLTDVALSDSVDSCWWGHCTVLRRLELEFYDVIEKSNNTGYVEHCPQLQELVLRKLIPDMVRYALIGARTLTSLSVQECQLNYLSNQLLVDAVMLSYLDLSKNNLMEVHTLAFNSQSRLQVLDLSYNHLQNIVLQDLLEPLKELRNLSLEGNLSFDACGDWSETPPPPLLERLSLRKTALEWFCFRKWESLTYIDLSESKISVLEINVLLRFPSLTVDLRGNDIIAILPDNNAGYDEMITKYKKVENVTILMDLVRNCDCPGGRLPRLLRKMPRFVLSGVRCAGAEWLDLTTVPIAQVECDKYFCAGCTCRRAWFNKTVEVDCRELKRRELPRIPSASSLLARGNLIDTLHVDDFPETLQLIDIRNNRLSHIDANVMAEIFSTKERRMRLSGNPLMCDCENEPMLTALRTHHTQIEDYDNITCAGDERTISEVVLEELCIEPESKQMWLLIALLATAIAVLSLTTTLLYRYERQIKVFLFAHGCCLSCLREEDVDADREYDAFVSFCHEDDDFVNDHLLPELKDYKLCIHYRDWIVGEWISAQIARSIEQSKRTIIVLSRSFLESLWGMLEFRMAHTSTLQEGRPRLIVVLLEDVLEDSRLDAELRGYLATNTYVRWGERWFWNKLRFALPHRQGLPEPTENEMIPGMQLCERQMPP